MAEKVQGSEQSRGRIALGMIGLLVFALAAWQILAARQGLTVMRLADSNPPLAFFYPADMQPGTRPLVLIGHGFAGSANLMEGFALTIARAGYVAAVWDFAGHGTNPEKLDRSQPGRLLQDAETVLAEAQRRGLAAQGKFAILGHSMGSGVALQFGLSHPESTATIAISPVSASVTSELPRNLLLMAGSLEANFVSNAESLLAQAGGAGGDLAQGTARRLVVIPGVEHITILFKPQTHTTALEWLDGAFGTQPGRQSYVDRRLIWYGLGVLGALLAAAALTPASLRGEKKPRPLWRRLAALAIGAVAATLLLALASLAGLNLGGLLGVQVGGYLLVWFALAGLVALLVMAERPGLPSWRAVVKGLLVFAVLWISVGLLGSRVWLPWWLYPGRLVLWPLGALLALPWCLAIGCATEPAGLWGKAGWWLAQSVVVCGSLLLALLLSQELFFILLILPIFPLILAFQALAAARQSERWSAGLGAAMFVGWLLLAVFPLA